MTCVVSIDCAYAHSKPNQPVHTWHPLEQHLLSVANLAADFMRAAGLPPEWGHVAGILHDVGKYSQAFQQRLLLCADADQPAHLEGASSHHVDHSTAGAQFAVKALSDSGKLIAYAVAGHHSGLLDGLNPDGPSLQSRLQATVEDWSACPKHLLTFSKLPLPPVELTSPRVGFQLAFFTRMLFSCLTDADFLDTEAFLSPEIAAQRVNPIPLDLLEQRLSSYLARFKPSSPLNQLRAVVQTRCRAAATYPPGFFSLTVPTGGGKTLSSLSFALAHAIKHNLRRVIYVIPYTTIIEQNANVFREALGAGAVLEHHCHIDPQRENTWSYLAAENWNASLIVTTNVQFFESLFASRTSACRKLHNIARSVIILDEAQMLPPDFLRPCIEALRELVRAYGCSVLLCTATQPALSSSPEFPDGLDHVTEIIPDPHTLYEQLKRVNTSYLGPLNDDQLAQHLIQHPQVLCIVNTRPHARTLARLLPDAIHLSALLCPAHRENVLSHIRERLSRGAPCRVISTSLVEAGVDIDFPVVYRAIAGIDSLAQAAGRCNREAKLPQGCFFIFEPADTSLPSYLRQAAEEASLVLRRYSDPLSLDAVHDFFRAYYWRKGDALDKHKILEKLSQGCQGNIPFRTVAESFALIDDNMKPVIILFDEHARSLISAARFAPTLAPFARLLQRYLVQVPPKEWDALLKGGALEVVRDLFPVLTCDRLYHPSFGLLPLDELANSPEAFICT